MSFFDKLNQFREAKGSVKEDDAHNENNVSMPAASLGVEQPLDSHRDGIVEQDPISIKDLWQQAVEMHREKAEHTKTEELAEESVPAGMMPEQDKMEDGMKDEPIPSVQWPNTEELCAKEPSFTPMPTTEDREFQELLAHVASAASTISTEDNQPFEISAHEQSHGMEEQVNFQTEKEGEVEERASEGHDQEEYNEAPIQSLFDISVEALQEDIDQAIISIYSHTQQLSDEWFGFPFPEKELRQLKESKLGEAFQAIHDVHSGHGYISEISIQAAQQLLPLLWKGSLEKEYHVAQGWYETPLGFLFRYILSGTRQEVFDPIDVRDAASMLNWTEAEVIEKYPQLGGVKLSSGYVFSRQKVKECMLIERKESLPALTLDQLEEFYSHTKQGLMKLMRVSELMNEMYHQLRYVRELLLSGTDFTSNRIKLPIKIQVEQRLCDLYQKFKEMDEYSFSAMQMNRRDVISYTVPNVFQTLDQLGGTVISAEGLVRSLEQSIQLVGDERESLDRLISHLTSNLGQLSMERELHEEHLTGAKL